MNFLRTLWPIPFKVKKGSFISLIWKLIVFLVVTFIFGLLIGLLANIPVIGIIFSIIGGLMDLYCIIGIILCLLVFFGVLK